jgi:hypothetical protein
MKKAILCLALVALLATGGQAVAEICAIDPVPAATVLLPYFAVDLDDPAGITTLFSLGNASAAPQLAHVTFWTDLSVPTLDFDIYLTGYDIVTVNLRDVFTDGVIPQTGENVFPAGDFSLPNVAFPNCDLPLGNLPAILVDHIVAMHTGNESPLENNCGGANRGNNTAVGYITIDNVNECNFLFPSNAGYFGTGGVANDFNTLWGDWFLIDPANAFAQGDNLVSLEADATLEAGAGGPNQTGANSVDYTFYGRYVASTGIDHREPLATTWAARYLNGGAFTGGTDLLCWRDTGIVQTNFACGTTPAPFPLAQEQIVIFDEDENPDLIEQPPFSPGIPGVDILPCPYEVTRVSVGGPSFPVPFDFGWTFLELSTTTTGAFDPYKQAYVTQVHDALGLFSVGYSGIALDSACDPNNLLLPVPGNAGNEPVGGTF